MGILTTFGAALATLWNWGHLAFRVELDLAYLQGQINGAVSASVILLGLYLLANRPTPRS